MSLLDLQDEEAVEEVLSLWNEVFDGGWRDSSWFGWKHRDNPMGPSVIAIAREYPSARLAAARAFWRFDLQWGPRVVRAYQPCDTATAPDFRRQGLFTSLTCLAIDEVRDQGADLLFNFPNGVSRPAYTKLGWSEAGGIAALARCVKPLRVGGRVVRAMGRVGSFDYDVGVDRGGHDGEAAWPHLLDGEEDENELIRAKREPEVFAWRYGRHPRHGYRIFAQGDAGLVGHLGRRKGLAEFRILALLGSARSDPRRARACLTQAETSLDPDLMSIVLHRDHPSYAVLRKTGFIPVPSRTSLFFRTLRRRDLPGVEIRWGLDGTERDTG